MLRPAVGSGRLGLLAIAATLLLPLAAASPPAPAIGDRAPAIVLKDIRWLPRTLADFGQRPAIVLAFTAVECPIAQRYVPRLVELEKEYRERGVQFALVDACAGDTLVEAAADAVERGVEFPLLKDFGGGAAAALGVTRTPEVVVLDGELRLRYRGRIDAQYRLGGVKPDRGREDLRLALDAVLAGKPVEVEDTPVDGCAISAETTPVPLPDVTWAEHVAPIVFRRCAECHVAKGEAPFTLTSYADVAKRLAMIDEVVAEQRMPPWYGSRAHGEIANVRSLSATERTLVRGWIAAGAPEGDAAEAPPAPQPRASDWRIGEPDLVVTQLGVEEIPADGYVPYRYVALPHVFLSDTWVSAIEIRGDRPASLHHANLAFIEIGKKFRMENFLTGTVPGGDPMQLDPGCAALIPAGSVLGLECHYVTTGKRERCRISVALKFPREVVEKRLHHAQIANLRFEIPPYAPAHPVAAQRTFRDAITGVGMFSHMHLRGRDMTFKAVYPDGRDEILLRVPNYSFDWQQSYRWAPGTKRFPAGTRVEVLAHFDNSTFNPFNPDPSRAVRFGQQTFDEMMYGFFFYYVDGEQLGLRVDPGDGQVVD